MLVTQETFNLKSTITDDWGGSHRVVLDLEALSSAKDWKIGVSLPDDYKIDQIYGAELTQEGGKTYISGKNWNKNLNQGAKTEIVLIVEEGNSANSAPILPQLVFAEPVNNSNSVSGLVSQDTFDIESTVTDDWGNKHRVALNLEALASAKDWKMEVSIPNDYEISEIYGAKLTQEGGKTYLSGENWNQSLDRGAKTEIVLIVDEGNASNADPVLPQLVFGESVNNSSAKPVNNSNSVSGLVSQDTFDLKSTVTDDWGNKHRVALNIEALDSAQDWKLEISIPNDYEVSEIYGAKLTQEGGKTYLSGENWNKSLDLGAKTEVVLIVDENNASDADPVLPQFLFADSVIDATTEPTTLEAEPLVEAVSTEDIQPLNAVSNEVADTQSNTVADNSNIINVDSDFGGNLEKAIAAAEDGDTVQLGGNVYYTDGITLSKDITIDGQKGSVINGGGTSQPIFSLTQGATGATIQDVEITNGTNAISSYRAFDLTLQNLNINNIGLTQTVRDGQFNTGLVLNHADGLRLLNTTLSDLGRKGVGVNDTNGAMISGLSVQNVNLDAQHAQSFDAAGIKFYNNNNVTVKDSYFSNINAMSIWSDTNNATTIENNVVENVGSDFLAPSFNTNVEIAGIYNEKSSNSVIKYNDVTALDGFSAFNATEFSTESMTLEGNNFSSMAVNTQDYWVNESVEKLIATTEDPDAANFNMFADEYFAQANIG